jgi:hypothetical protein
VNYQRLILCFLSIIAVERTNLRNIQAELAIKPDHVATAMVGQATFLLKEHGYSNDEVMGVTESALKNFGGM